MPETHQLKPGNKIRLARTSTTGKDFHDDRDAAEAEFEALRLEMAELQYKLYAEGKRKLLIVLQAMDTGGKDSTIRKVFRGVNPQGMQITSFKAPSSLELDHDYLWRIHAAVPAKGKIGVFNRSHYEDVLVVRVENLVPEKVWKQRYEQINQFEQLLAASGTTILKFYLHISKEEQRQRLQERIDMPEKHWKFNTHDLIKRAQWDEYQSAYEAVLRRCTSKHAPWHVIPADQKWYRNLAIARVIVDTLRKMDPKFPPPEQAVDGITVD